MESTNRPEMDSTALDDLDIQVYDQEKFEAKVMKGVDEALEKQERERQVELRLKELGPLFASLGEVEEQLKAGQRRLKSLHSGNATLSREQHRKTVTLLDQQEELDKKAKELREKQVEIAKELKTLGHDVDADDRFRRVTKNLDEKEDVAGPSAQELLGQSGETEKEKNIRLGQMTAFGSSLKTQTDCDQSENYQQYVLDQVALNGGKVKRQNGKKKEKKKERNDVESGVNTDDSDWLSSSDEEKTPKARKHSQKSIDDGDREEYLERLERWQEEEKEKDNTKAEKLDGGLLVPGNIWQKLYSYQRVCVQWLWELHQQKVGGILGDEMGLGKTIQIIAFLASMSYSQRKMGGSRKFGPILIVCPTTVMHQWVKEFHKWWPAYRVAILHESGSHKGSRNSLIRSVASSAGILVTSFNGVVAQKDTLLNQDFQYVILDEGHKIRNPDAQVTLAVKMFHTPHRLILSGSPLQNNLKELWSLFDFIYPGKLGTLPVFLQQFSVPITQGGYSNATRVQVATAYKCATVLRDTINPYLLRRMKSDVKHHINLPEKNEQVLFCRLTDAQRDVYKGYLDSGEIKSILDGRIQVFVGLTNLRKICNHPDLFNAGLVHDGGPDPFDDERQEQYGYWKRSGKMIVIQSLLKLWNKQGHRVLLFTQSRQMLTLLESFVLHEGYTYLKLDGSTSIGSRQPLIDKFNSSPDLFVFLLTTKVGGLGVNLTGASRVVIFDPDWNPSTDTQARERAWRIGQDKQVTIYRLLTAGTIEEKIYHRQIFKQFLVNRILKDPKQKRFFKSNDLYELFTLNEGTSDRTETSAIFAGTGSDVKPTKAKKRSRDATETAVASFKPKKRRDDGTMKNVKSCLAKVMEDKKDESAMTEREKLMEKARRISRMIEKGKDTTERPDKKEKRQKKKKKKRARFEGTKVDNLVKTGQYQAGPSNEEDEGGKKSEEQDNYVLSKLFKKSGVHSAVQHDVIVDGDGDDYVLIEGEAEKVARDAVESLRQSRRECFRAEAGVPTWTGQNGARKRFGKKSKTTEQKYEFGAGTETKKRETKKMTSSDLLQRMKERNRFHASERGDSSVGVSSDNMELLADLRNFLCAQSVRDREATTKELLDKFVSRVPAKDTPLFKSLLNEICTFHKDNDRKGSGIWRLKPEFS